MMAIEGPMESEEPPQSDAVIEAYKRDVDRTLIRENLKLTVTQRFEKLMAMQRFADELRRAGRSTSIAWFPRSGVLHLTSAARLPGFHSAGTRKLSPKA